MKRRIMSEHLTLEQVAALIDDSQGAQESFAHMEQCELCTREFEQMSRMRMALSALPDIEPPSGEWDRIESMLPGAPTTVPITSRRRESRSGHATRSTLTSRPARSRFAAAAWPVQAAAVLMLFAGGLWVGTRVGVDGGSSAGDEAALTDVHGQQVQPAAFGGAASGWSDSYLRAVSNLEALRDELNAGGEWPDDPALLTERLNQYDELLSASKAALRQAPAEPAINDFVFGVQDERDDLADRLDQTLRMASVEY